MKSCMIGRRVESIGEITQPGDYWFDEFAKGVGKPAIFFLLPNAREEGASEHQSRLHYVVSPPHKFRHCEDGSIEIRESIGAEPSWHGYLDEGHFWREI